MLEAPSSANTRVRGQSVPTSSEVQVNVDQFTADFLSLRAFINISQHLETLGLQYYIPFFHIVPL